MTVFQRLITVVILTAVTAALIALSLRGRPLPPPIGLLVAYDTSDSDRVRLPASIRTSAAILSSLDDWDHLELFRVDNETRQFHSGRPIVSREKLIPILNKELKPKSEVRGTKFHLFAKVAAQALRNAVHPTVVVLFSDCEPDDMTPSELGEYRAAIKQLANCQNLAGFALIGIRNTVWVHVNSDFAPLRDRLGHEYFLTQGENDFAPSPLRNLITAVRSRSTLKGVQR
jgi:hypothetical protein